MEGVFGEEQPEPVMPPYEAFKFEFPGYATESGDSMCRRVLSEFLNKMRQNSKGNTWHGVQLAGIKHSIMEVNEAAWALLEEICAGQSMIIVGTTTLISPRPNKLLDDIVAGEMTFQYLRRQPQTELKVYHLKSGSSWAKHQKNVAEIEKCVSGSGLYIHPLFAEFAGRKLFIIYPVIRTDVFQDEEAEIYDWIVQLSTTLLTLMQVEKPQAAGIVTSEKQDLKTLTQHFKTGITQGTEMDLSKRRSFAWHQTESVVMYDISTLGWTDTQEQECKLEEFISSVFASCKEQAVTPVVFKALLDEVRHDNRVKAASKSEKNLGPSARTAFVAAHSAKFAELVGSLGKVLFLEDEELDRQFEVFVKKLAEDTLPEYKSGRYYVEKLQLLAKRSFEWEFKVFKEAYATKMQVFRNQEKQMDAKFANIEGMLISACEDGTLKDLVKCLPKLYAFDLTAIKIENEDLKLLPQLQLWATMRHDHHEQCVRSAIQALEHGNQKLESDFADHFMNPEGVPVPKKLNHLGTKESFKANESIANLVRIVLDKKYALLLEATEARKASVEEELARNKLEVREKHLVLLKEQFGLAQNQWNGMAMKKENGPLCSISEEHVQF